jgi:hypothetical protein
MTISADNFWIELDRLLGAPTTAAQMETLMESYGPVWLDIHDKAINSPDHFRSLTRALVISGRRVRRPRRRSDRERSDSRHGTATFCDRSRRPPPRAGTSRCPSQWLHSERKLDDVPASLADGDINLAPLRRGFFLERSKFRRSRLASAPSFRQR